MKIRRANLEDLETLIRFTSEEAREAEGSYKNLGTLRKGIEAALNDENLVRYWLLIDDHHHPVGCVSALREWSDWNAGYYWWIESLYITPSYRKKGYMSQLIKAVRVEAKQQGALELRLYVHQDNENAIRAYERDGFKHSLCKLMVQDL